MKLADALGAELEDPEGRCLVASILGSTDPRALAAEIGRVCREVLGTGIADCLLFEVSVGAVFGLRLEDGRDVLLKLHGPDADPAGLRAAAAVQSRLSAEGFPCPAFVRPPARVHGRVVGAEAWVDVGERADAHAPRIRRAMAACLADLLARTARDRPAGIAPDPLPADRPWPPPHNALFDFEATRAGAEWIDALAGRARAVLLEPAAARVGHCDWSVKHFRFEGSRVRVVYDWDSLRTSDEARLVGAAAATFPVTPPAPEESRAFVEDYAEARGRPLDPAERRRIRAAVRYTTCYVARCEHALDPEGRRWEGSFRQSLATTRGSSSTPVGQ